MLLLLFLLVILVDGVDIVGMLVDGAVVFVLVVEDWGAGAGGAMEFIFLLLLTTTTAALPVVGVDDDDVVPGGTVDGTFC